ncbi:MAG: hypothetical protein QM368_05645 [Bacillota bacterium]|jgi:hypothetical protein|nr:hypothetical protein [Bacillota bacterium]HHU30925.1 hypothetical protein [Bacillota bacterium]
MRKVTALFLVGLILLLVACNGGNNGSVANSGGSGNREESKDEIEVDKNLFSVAITIPGSFFGSGDLEEIKAEAELEEGIKEVRINSDGSLTYIMSRAAHKKMIAEMKEALEETIREMINSGDYPSIIDIKANKSYTEFLMVVDQENYENSFDELSVLILGMGSMLYQIFNGADAETANVAMYLEDAYTGEVFDTIILPDDWN